MSKFILSSFEKSEIYVSSIRPEELLGLSDKVFVNRYGHKSSVRIVQDAKLGNEKNYRLILSFQTGQLVFQLQSSPIDGEYIKRLGFQVDETIQKYEDIGGMFRKLDQGR